MVEAGGVVEGEGLGDEVLTYITELHQFIELKISNETWLSDISMLQEVDT